MKLYPELSGQKILVTGASGFIGSSLCYRLRKSGAEVHAVSRVKYSDLENGLRWWQGDLADIATVRNLLTTIKPDIIFHLASHVSGVRDRAVVLPTFHSNLMTTVNLLIVAADMNCRRVILAGSLEEPEPGDAEPVPGSPYAAAKWASSAYARMFHALYQTPVVVARLFMVYGPRQRDLRKLVPYVTLSLLRQDSPKLTSGQRLIDWIYVEDVINGLLTMAHAPEIEGCIIDLGSGELAPIRTVVQYLMNLVNSQGQPLFGALSERPMEQVRVANTENTFAKIGWKPATSLEKGLEYTVNWYREQLRKGEIALILGLATLNFPVFLTIL